MLATTGNNQIFGMNLKLKMVMPQLTVWNPKDLHLVDTPNARSQILGFIRENLITTL